MLNRFRIGPRLVILISVQTIALFVIGLIAITGLRFSATTTQQLNKNVVEQVALNQMNEVLRSEVLGTVFDLFDGRISWERAQADLLAAKNAFSSDWEEYQADKTPSEIEELRDSLAKHHQNVMLAFADLEKIVVAQDKGSLANYVDKQIRQLVTPFIVELNDRVAEQQIQSEELFQQSIKHDAIYFYGSIAAVVAGLALAITLGVQVFRSIAGQIKTIETTVNKVSEGDHYARTNLSGTDELSTLGSVFDHLLAERVATLVQVEQDNEKLNESVITLLQAVSKLSQRDLTIKLPVTEDVTGPIADALNQLTSETARVLLGVRRIAEQVAKASTTVRTQSDAVIAVAENEQSEIEETSIALAQAAATLNHIGELAQTCDHAAEGAINTTQTALQAVTNTIEGIGGIRTTIHETEKRIKRLGERSQDIGRAINLIGNIAERTHILALNASMHAAAAGEAGRGFAVVADEVQRLAENARDATQQIATLVSNIQNETSETVITMNDVITQVVAGSRLAEMAGEQMRRTRDSTAHLVESVRSIAKDTEDQIRLSTELQGRAHTIQASTRKTRDQLEEQTQHTKRLVQYSRGLLTAVQVFTLPTVASIGAENAVVPESAVDTTTAIQKRA